jgi:four helix bundle protein
MSINNKLSQRLFSFSVDVIRFLRILPKNTEYRVIHYQLVKSSTSSGANYEEAQAGTSRADFNNKVRISLKEMRESNYWLRILQEIINDSTVDNDYLKKLIKESNELNKILGTIVNKTDRRERDS